MAGTDAASVLITITATQRENSVELIETDVVRTTTDTLELKDAPIQGFLEELKEFAKKVHRDVQNRSQVVDSTNVDALKCFKVNPEGYDNPSLSADELWEDVLNGVLKNGLGWGTELNVPSLLDTDGSGLMGLANFTEYFVVKRGRKDTQIGHLRTRALTQAKTVASISTALSDHKRFAVAIASGKVGNMERIVRIALKQKRGIRATLLMLQQAAAGVYHPKSFAEEDYMRALLLWKLGGNRIAGIVQRCIGLPE
ncbi:hypothetical protein HYPSUDRAFT_210322, partial [Hypholoma sublateritium FD-334 SS-4]